MSAKKKETNESVEQTTNQVPEEPVQVDLSAEENPLTTGQRCQVAFCSGLNLRDAPGMHAPVLQVLPAETEVLIDPLEWVADGTGVWFPVTVAGVNGFVNGQYLAPVEE